MTTKIKAEIRPYELQRLIGETKEYFALQLRKELGLVKVEGPLFVEKNTGINDDLNGVERPVRFTASALGEKQLEIVQSLAKWKRLRLSQLTARTNEGLYVDMRALRPDEEISKIHSVYVDQWDWEKVIDASSRTIDYLKEQVRQIYSALRSTESFLADHADITPILPQEVTFIHSEDLLDLYPELTPKQREDKFAKLHGAVFVIGIGHELADGKEHDLRSPDYDDWSTTVDGKRGLNGDLLVWNPVLERAFELSSMGIRVDKTALEYQLSKTGKEERKELYWHKLLLSDQLPLTIGGGIGQSRLAMFLLRKEHIAEVQESVWNN
jgi:aspartate--ammonia ligase